MIRRLIASSLLLAASCALADVQQLQLAVLPAGTLVQPGQSIDFGTVATADSKTLTLILTNDGPDDAILTRLSIDGSVFSLKWAGGSPVGLHIPVGETLQFTVTFAPVSAGPAHLGQLWVQIAVPASSPIPVLQPQVEYDLAGTGDGPGVTPTPTPTPTPSPTPPPVWPRASIATQPGVLANDQQATISIQFESTLPASAAGLLTLDFTGKGDTQRGFILPDKNGTFAPSQVSFTLAPGDTVARFGGQPGITFQTGVTASTLTFTAKLADGTPLASQSYTIAPAAVVVDRVLLERAAGSGANGVLVTALGFDNTRTAASVSFTFFDTANHQIGQPVSVDATAAFRSYFQSAGTGLFGLKQAFTVGGDINGIGSVVVSIANSQGTSAPETGSVQ